MQRTSQTNQNQSEQPKKRKKRKGKIDSLWQVRVKKVHCWWSISFEAQFSKRKWRRTGSVSELLRIWMGLGLRWTKRRPFGLWIWKATIAEAIIVSSSDPFQVLSGTSQHLPNTVVSVVSVLSIVSTISQWMDVATPKSLPRSIRASKSCSV